MLFLYVALVFAGSWSDKFGGIFRKSDEAAAEAERLEVAAREAKRRAAEADDLARKAEELESPSVAGSSYRRSYSRRYSFSN